MDKVIPDMDLLLRWMYLLGFVLGKCAVRIDCVATFVAKFQEKFLLLNSNI